MVQDSSFQASAETPSHPVPYIRYEHMTLPIRRRIEEMQDLDAFWTDDWSPDFYRAQARLGFIAVCHQVPATQAVLIPELQKQYAVLDWHDLRLDRQVKRILDPGRVRAEGLRLVVEADPAEALEQLVTRWGEQGWVRPAYVALVKQLASEEEKERDAGFRVWGVRLVTSSHAGASEETVAGEIGYTIGRTYTSLSGFHRRDDEPGDRRWNNYGKAQLVLLARHLEHRGVAFWNLGHPYMDYKTRLGARVVSRAEFLRRWDVAVSGVAVDIALG